MITIFFTLLFSISTFAQFRVNKVVIDNANLDYVTPRGAGFLEKLTIGSILGESFAPYPFEILVENEALLFQSPVIEFTLGNLPKFVEGIEKLSTTNLNASLSYKDHSVKAKQILFQPKKYQPYSFTGVDLHCQGNSEDVDLVRRMMLDCQENMSGVVTKLDISVVRYIMDVLGGEPEGLVAEELPNDLILSLKKGKLFLNVVAKFIIKARARAWGEVIYENDYQTIAIRVDQVKYGIIPVTGIVMKQLRSRVKHPRVKVTPPWIRIYMGKM